MCGEAFAALDPIAASMAAAAVAAVHESSADRSSLRLPLSIILTSFCNGVDIGTRYRRPRRSKRVSFEAVSPPTNISFVLF